MPSSPQPDAWITRAQVWLGTLVEVSLPPGEAGEARFTEAFAAIAHVHHTMSAHEPTSDLARIAREAHLRTVVVSAETHAVLQLAMTLWRESGGAFDVTIAPVLARDGQLPEHAAGCAAVASRMGALQLLEGSGVRATEPVALDLGGIAKGFAVDRAVEALRASGTRAGLVNAGGDLRVFDADAWLPLRVRRPSAPMRAVHLFDVRIAAVATSADYFRDGRPVLVEPLDASLRGISGSITVVADSCALADALTKIVALDPSGSTGLLLRHGAHAFILGDVDSRCATTCAKSTANLRLPFPVMA